MLTITNFQAELKALGVNIFAIDGNVKIQGNLSAMTPDQKDWLRSHKAAVLAMLCMQRNPVTRYISLDGQCEAFASHTLDPAYWRPATGGAIVNPNLDTDGQRLQKLIEKRRMALGMMPNRWRVLFFRLVIVTAAVAGVLQW